MYGCEVVHVEVEYLCEECTGREGGVCGGACGEEGGVNGCEEDEAVCVFQKVDGGRSVVGGAMRIGMDL